MHNDAASEPDLHPDPHRGGFDGSEISAFKIAASGYDDLMVTEFNKFQLFIVTTYDLGTLCLRPRDGQPDDRPGDGGGPAGCFHAMWTHGPGVQLENPEAAVSVTRFGWGTRVVGKPNTGGWFHFAIPTPVIGTCYRSAVGGEIGFRYRLLRVLIRVHTSGDDVRVRSVHVWDGDIRLQMYDGLTVTKGPLTQAFDVPARPSVVYGIGVSIRVEFGSAGGWVTFIAAGGDFLLSDACSCK